MKLYKLIYFVCLTLILGACTSNKVCPGGQGCPINYIDTDYSEKWGETFSKILKQKAIDGKALRVLAMSGGGAKGAWGAGVFKNLYDTNESQNFDIISGVSTGALVAPLAYLVSNHNDDANTQLYLDTMKTSYTNSTKKDVADCSLFKLLFRGYYCDASPLRRLIDQSITDEVIKKIGMIYKSSKIGDGEYSKHLLLGTVNTGVGAFRVWNMGEIAMAALDDRHPDPNCNDNIRSEEWLTTFRDIVRASTAIPIFFNGQNISNLVESCVATTVRIQNVKEIDKLTTSIHQDGGLRFNLFLPKILSSTGNAQDSTEFKDVGIDITAIVNTNLKVRCEPHSDLVHKKILRSVEIVFNQSSISELELLKLFSDNRITNTNFRYSSIPDSLKKDGDLNKYTSENMTRLYSHAVKKPFWQSTIGEVSVCDHS